MKNYRQWLRLALCLFAALLTVGMMLMSYSARASRLTTVQTDDSSESALSIEWQTYVDLRYGYSIQYPEDWYVFPTPQKGMGATAQFYSYDRDLYPAREIPVPEGEIKIEIVVLDPPGQLEVSEWLSIQASTPPIRGKMETQEMIKVDGIEGIKMNWYDDPYSATIFMIPYAQKLLQIVVSPTDSDLAPVLDVMIDSFQWEQD